VGQGVAETKMARNQALRHWKIAHSTYARRSRKKALVTVVLAAGLLLVPLATTGDAAAISIPGITGFITSDGLFFVQIGYQDLIGFTTYIDNGSLVYSAGVVVNVTAITASAQVAHISIYDYSSGSTIANENVLVPAYSSIAVDLPSNHSNVEYKASVDSTPWWFYAFTPYSFLGFTGLQDGGVDIATFIAIAVFFAWAFPLMLKAERMTKRAIFAPRWQAKIWFHGIFAGLLASYAAYFSWWNQTLQGWEFIIIPIPEALFLFFWTAGRHSQNRRALFVQIVPRVGQRLAVIMRSYFVGKDADGDLVVMRSYSPIQWWYRSRGHHVKVFRRREAGALEPFPLDVLEQSRLTEEQVRDPARFPRGAKYDAHDDFPVVNSDESEDFPFERLYFIPRLSAFRITWPRMRITKEVPVPEHTDAATMTVIPAGHVTKWCWPYIEDGHAEVTLCSWHFMDVLAQAMGYMTAEDAAEEANRLSVQLAAERGFRYTETGRKASSQINAEYDLRDRPESDLPENELERYVTPLPARRERKALPGEKEAGA
jgi:hypothetical protein